MMAAPIKAIVTAGSVFGLLPKVWFFTVKELEDSITSAGFHIDHQWHPGPGKAVFIVAKKAP